MNVLTKSRSLCIVLALLGTSSVAESASPLPAAAENWKVELLAEDAISLGPTAVVETPDGTIFIGQDPMDLNGPPDVPADFVLRLRWRDGVLERTVFADKLSAVMGLELIGDTLFVVNAPFLTALRDLDGDGVADERTQLITRLGPELPAFNGYNDHVASGIRAGMDGFLYFTFGDKGLHGTTSSEGTVISHGRGGVLRIRPDGTDMELVASGLRNPLSVALDAADNVFIYGNDDDGKVWPNALIHIIETGHYGYPYEFRDRPHLCLPIITGKIGGAGSQGFCFNESGLAARFEGDLFFTDWGLQTLIHFDVESDGATHRLVKREDILSAGPLGSFRPFSALTGGDGNSILVVDWGFGSKLAAGHRSGRLFRLTYHGPDARRSAPAVDPRSDLDKLAAGLSHASHRERLRAQRALAARLPESFSHLTGVLADRERSAVPRRHALWALDTFDDPRARDAIDVAIDDLDARVRAQAIRAVGIRRRAGALSRLLAHLDDSEANVRRETAIALGRIGSREAARPLLEHMGDADRFVAWAMGTAFKRIGVFVVDWLAPVLLEDGPRQENLTALLDDTWRGGVVSAWARVARAADATPERRHLAYRKLGELYYRFPPWDGFWFGTHPLLGRRPERTRRWSRHAERAIQSVLGDALEDASVDTRRAALEAAKLLRGDAGPIFLERSRHERVPELRLAVVEALAAAGRIDGDEFLRLATDVNESETLRVAAARALASSETSSEFLVLLLDDSRALPGVVAIALTALGRHGRVSASTLEQWSSNTDVEIRVAVAAVLGMGKVSVPRLDAWLIEMLDAKDVRLVRAAVEAIAARKIFAATELLALYKTHEDLRSQILSALTAVPFAPALDVYLDGLAASSPDARRRSAAALLALRSQIVDELVQRAENQQVSRAALPRVERVVSLFEPIVKWRVIGPFPREAPAGIGGNTSIDFSQELFGAGGTRVAWRSVSGGAPYGTVDLDTFFDGVSKSSTFGFDKNNANRINAFAHAIVDSPTERDALVLLGSSGSIRIWVNGENAYRRRNRAGRAFDPEEDLVRIRLRRGTNQIMVQSHAGIGRWRFSVRVSGGDQALDLSLISTGNHREELRSTALNYRGDPDRGWALFTRKDGPQCGRCHVVRGQGGSLGPNLMGFAKKYDRAEAIASILEPTARLTTGYTSVVVATNEGEVLTGLIRNESATFLALVDAEGNEKRIPKASIVQRQLSQVSIMPEGLVDSLSGEEFRDLVDFLMSLDGPE